MARVTALARAKALQTPLLCDRCGRYDGEVMATSILGHKVRPERTTRNAKASSRLLCRGCLAAMEEEQPDLFGEVTK